MRGDQLAVDATAFLGEPVQEGGRIGDLAARLGEGFALLGGHDAGQVLLVEEQPVVPAAQACGPLPGSECPPTRPGTLGRGDRPPGLGGAHGRHLRDHLTIARVSDRQPRAIVGRAPGAIDQRLLAQQGCIGDVHLRPRGRRSRDPLTVQQARVRGNPQPTPAPRGRKPARFTACPSFLVRLGPCPLVCRRVLLPPRCQA